MIKGRWDVASNLCVTDEWFIAPGNEEVTVFNGEKGDWSHKEDAPEGTLACGARMLVDPEQGHCEDDTALN